MSLFIKFHKNDLHGVVAKLISVYKTLEFEDETLNTRYINKYRIIGIMIFYQLVR